MNAAAAALTVNKPAPPIEARLLDGQSWSLAAQRGDVVIVNYWATWCVPCMAEFAAFKSFLAAHPDAHLQILAVSMDDAENRAQVEKLARTLSFPLAMAADVQAKAYGRIWRLPVSFVIDRAGLLRVDGGVGEQKPFDDASLQRDIAPLLADPAP